MPEPKRMIFFFVRLPEPGRTKTRLAAHAGDEEAANLYRIITEDITLTLKRAAGFTPIIYGTPANQLGQLSLWLNDGQPPVFEAVPQSEGDLAQRLDNAVNWAFEKFKADEVYLAGSDCPELQTEDFQSSAAALEHHDAVIGRAKDGGFYLLGMKNHRPFTFSGVEYSSEQTAEQLIAKLRSEGWSVDQDTLPMRNDIDEISDVYAMNEETKNRLKELAERRMIHSQLLSADS